ncbi:MULTISPECIES: twin-arginine translocase TatA/TatE family subunit [unclassified Bacillus (in: firmicutes)]|jgi:sec-independent protein translocase protein TatA|uniref:twin-arginine translocase TatA/TatE family subunit n=1 Tax=unclassified Bacillus (in: firmicutes) TaxID=185979 RepID=UPI0009DCB0FF|nr:MULTISPECIES: twin-arginine translocase TatA/TatE family subunit [unclassified Bacillus (in: firmicutes)]
MLSNIGVPGMILILIVALIVFGPNKLPEIGRAVGSSIREFKRASEGLTEEIKKEIKEK